MLFKSYHFGKSVYVRGPNVLEMSNFNDLVLFFSGLELE